MPHPDDLPLEIDCRAAQQALAGSDAPPLIDCRETDEYSLVHIAGSRLLPMSTMAARVAELQSLRDSRLIVHCHHGVRSLDVVHWLRSQGFAGAQSMRGGIDRWSLEIDPSLPRY